MEFKTKTPAEIWYKAKPNLSHIKVFGSICYNHIPKENRTKLDSKVVKCRMLGYGSSQFTYRLWDSESNKLVIERHVTFNEKSILEKPNEAQPVTVDIFDSETDEENPVCNVRVIEGNSNNNNGNNIEQDGSGGSVVTLRRSNRERRRPDRYEASLAEHTSFCAQEFVQNDPISMENRLARMEKCNR